MTPFATADLCDAYFDEVQVLELALRDFGGREAFYGRVETIRAFEDNSLVRQAVERAGDEQELVVDGGGSMRRAMLGDNLAAQAVHSSWSGIVINGCIRDSAVIGTMDLGVKALGTCPIKTEKRGLGDLNVPLRFGGVTIAPGYWLYADADGVVLAERNLLG